MPKNAPAYNVSVHPRFRVIATAWFAYALFFSTQAWMAALGTRRELPWPRVFALWLICAAIWAAFTPLMLALLRRFPLRRGRELVRNALLHVAASGAISAGALAIFILVTRQALALRDLRMLLVAEFHVGLIIYWTVLAVAVALEKRIAAAELGRAVQQARLDALRTQLQPHFLFNTLSSIAILIDEEPETARAMIVQLSELLRSTVDMRENEVSLRDELDVLERYLAIARMRFRDRLTVSFDVEPAALDCRVPSFVLQPLVENALRHGIAAHAGAGRIVISAHAADGDLVLSVSDDGSGFAQPLRLNGVGLASVRERLAQLYPGGHSLSLRNREPRGCEVSILIPMRKAAA